VRRAPGTEQDDGMTPSTSPQPWPRVERVEQLGTVLGIWGHPDDEAYLSGGLMAAAVAAGQRVVCVTATRGEAGFPDDDTRPLDERVAIREAELDACLTVLGVTEHRWLDANDGECDKIALDEVVPRMCDLIDEIAPDTVLTFGPDGMTGHVDHIAVSRWTTAAMRRLAPTGGQLLYATKTSEWNDMFLELMNLELDEVMMVDGMSPPTVAADDLAMSLRLDDDLVDRKVKALRCQASQVGGLVDQVGADGFWRLNREEFFRWPTPADWADDQSRR
jgi:LmbE family N-acetylglucosaminyl deacetylase